MRLTELEPRFLKIISDTTHREVESIDDADGIIFLCPVCFKKNNGPVGTHSVICWQPHVPLTRSPKPGRWNFVGAGIHDLTLKAGSSSIKLEGGCNAHFFIRNGNIE